MKRPTTRNKHSILAVLAVTLLALPFLSVSAGEKPFPKIVFTLDGSLPEGFAIGKGTTAYNGSIDGSIYKVNLRTGKGDIFVPADDPFVGCTKLGMRVDRRSNNLIVAGCEVGNALVFDADTGEPIMEYQLDDSGASVINDLAITQDAVYFTDFGQPFLYSLPLSKNGRIPSDEDAVTAIPLTGDFEEGDITGGFYVANGIAATPDGKTLIVGHSGSSKIFKVDPATGHADEIIVDPPLLGLLDGSFLDAIVLHDGVLYILSPGDTPDLDMVQVVVLDEDMLTGTRVGQITDPSLSGVASGAMHGNSLYVNNAHYDACCDDDNNPFYTETWITKLNIYDVE